MTLLTVDAEIIRPMLFSIDVRVASFQNGKWPTKSQTHLEKTNPFVKNGQNMAYKKLYGLTFKKPKFKNFGPEKAPLASLMDNIELSYHSQLHLNILLALWSLNLHNLQDNDQVRLG